MAHTKPQVVIDLDEYNELLALKKVQVDGLLVAKKIVATITNFCVKSNGMWDASNALNHAMRELAAKDGIFIGIDNFSARLGDVAEVNNVTIKIGK